MLRLGARSSRLVSRSLLSNSSIHGLKLNTSRAVLSYSTQSVLDDFYSKKNKNRWSTRFIGFLIFGFGCTVYGGYVLYETLTMWPPEIRADLREAVAAKMKGDFVTSERYFHRAWLTVKTLPISSLGTLPYLKLTGVAVSLADVLDISNKPEHAYDICQEALEILQREDVKDTLGGQERLRAVSLASKLGELAEQLGKPQIEEEKWKVWAVEEVLRVIKSEAAHGHETMDLPLMPLPKWVRKADIGAPLEQLGAFYAKTGRVDYAMPLYLQAISLLIPPAPKTSTPEDRCRGAQLMGNLSDLLMRGKPSPQTIHQAEAWASQALAVLQKARGESKIPLETCEFAYAAALFNVAAFKEMANDLRTARQLYKEGLDQSRAIHMQDGIVEASQALKRLDDVLHNEKEKEK